MDSYRIRYDEEDGRLDRQGIVTPKGSRVLAHQGRFISVKIAGASYTSGQNMRAYGSAEFLVYEEVYTDAQRRQYDEADPPNETWLASGDVNGWINVREVLQWPVRC